MSRCSGIIANRASGGAPRAPRTPGALPQLRVRSYVSETPVHEQVRLRNERVNVERRTGDQPLSAVDGDVFQERTISMTATGEEAVVGKTARVVEEVVVSKAADERVEEVSDTVRKTEVDVDRDDDVSTGSTFGTTDKR